MNYFPLCNYTHYSLQKGFSKPEELVKKCVKNGYPACGISDYKSLSGCVEHYKQCKKQGIKPILGCAFDGFYLFAKNHEGWLNLIEIVSSDAELDSIKSIFERGNLVWVGEGGGEGGMEFSPIFAPTYYTEQEDAPLHRILLCGGMKTTLPKVYGDLRKGVNVENRIFFEGDEFYLRSTNGLGLSSSIHPSEFNALEEIFNECEEYNILSNPILPKFPTPNGESEEEYLKSLCRIGWKAKLIPTDKLTEGRQVYLDRFNEEFGVIKRQNLFGYFLIVQDILNWVRSQGWMVGQGRGSVGGSLIAYLLSITEVDSVQYDLLFARFFNDGRCTEGNVSLPDIDMDVPAGKREEIIQYLRDKYGKDNVSQMATFGRLQGRSALKEVLRVNEACGFAEMNEITKYVPDEAAISDQLQLMGDEASIIRWALINRAEELRDYCFIGEDGRLQGDYSEHFGQAIRLEGTFKSQGKHAAGVVISAKPLHTMCPMTDQRNGKEKIAALEMDDLASIGGVKLDVLGLSALDRMMLMEQLINS